MSIAGAESCLKLYLIAAGRNLELKDELSALRDATAQSYAHAEDLKRQWADIEKAQQNLYQVRSDCSCLLRVLIIPVASPTIVPSPAFTTFSHCSR